MHETLVRDVMDCVSNMTATVENNSRDIVELKGDVTELKNTVSDIKHHLAAIHAAIEKITPMPVAPAPPKKINGDANYIDLLLTKALTEPIMIGEITPTGTITNLYQSPILHGTIGTPEDYIGNNIADFVNNDDLQRMIDGITTMAENKKPASTTITIKVNGSQARRTIRAMPLDNGHLVFISLPPEK